MNVFDFKCQKFVVFVKENTKQKASMKSVQYVNSKKLESVQKSSFFKLIPSTCLSVAKAKLIRTIKEEE